MVKDIIHAERNYQVDNIRAILIILVVFAHFLQIAPREESLIFRGIWIAVYSFHMPAFLFFAGMFSTCDVNKNGKSIINLLTLYLMMYVLVVAMKDFCGIPANLAVFRPTFATWFLLVLAIHRMLLPILEHVKYVVPISVVIALLSGCIEGCNDYLSVSRAFSLLPFFLAGYFFRTKGWMERIYEWKLSYKIIVCIAALFLCALFTLIMLEFDLSLDVVWAKKAYMLYGMTELTGLIMRAAFFTVAFFMIVMLIVLIPKKKTVWGYMGKNSLSVYVLHVVPFYLIVEYKLMPESPDLGGVFSLIAALITAIVLAAPWIYTAIDLVGKIPAKLLWKSESAGKI